MTSVRLLDQEAETAQPGRTKTLKEDHALIKKKIKFSPHIRLFRVEQLQRKDSLIHEEMRKYFPINEDAVINNFAPAPF
jgi:hypothetical protein